MICNNGSRKKKKKIIDTAVERNALIERVYPKLKEYCRSEYGLDFMVEYLFILKAKKKFSEI